MVVQNPPAGITASLCRDQGMTTLRLPGRSGSLTSDIELVDRALADKRLPVCALPNEFLTVLGGVRGESPL
jgi:hypothetical protein